MHSYSIEQVQRQFAKHAHEYDTHALAQQQICDKLTDLIVRFVDIKPVRIMEIGCGTGLLTRRLVPMFDTSLWWINDLSNWSEYQINQIFDQHNVAKPTYIWGNAEQTDFSGQFDAVVSSSTFQWFANLPAFFAKISQHLHTQGWFIFSTFAPDNLAQIRQLTGNSLPYPTLNQITQWLNNAGFNVLYKHSETITLQFDSPLHVLQHIKATGINGVFRQAWTRSDLLQFEQQYRLQFGNGEHVALTYTPLYIVCRLIVNY